jgi:hypothetical protein
VPTGRYRPERPRRATKGDAKRALDHLRRLANLKPPPGQLELPLDNAEGKTAPRSAH